MNELKIPVTVSIGEESAKGTIRFEIVTHPVPGNPHGADIELVPLNALTRFFYRDGKANIPGLLRLLADELEKQAATNGATL